MISSLWFRRCDFKARHQDDDEAEHGELLELAVQAKIREQIMATTHIPGLAKLGYRLHHTPQRLPGWAAAPHLQKWRELFDCAQTVVGRRVGPRRSRKGRHTPQTARPPALKWKTCMRKIGRVVGFSSSESSILARRWCRPALGGPRPNMRGPAARG